MEHCCQCVGCRCYFIVRAVSAACSDLLLRVLDHIELLIPPPGISGLLWQFQAFGIWWILITSLHNSGLSDFFQSTAMKKRRSYSPCDLVFGSQFILMLAIQLYTVYASFWLFFPAHLGFFIWISWLFNSSFFFPTVSPCFLSDRRLGYQVSCSPSEGTSGFFP